MPCIWLFADNDTGRLLLSRPVRFLCLLIVCVRLYHFSPVAKMQRIAAGAMTFIMIFQRP